MNTANLSRAAGKASLEYFQKKYPYVSKRQYSDIEFQKLQTRYGKWKTITIALLFLYMFGLPLLYGWIFYKCYVLLYAFITPHEYIFYPSTALIFGIPGFILGFATLFWPIVWTQKLFLRNEYEQFEDYYNNSKGYDNRKASLLVFKILIVPAIIGLWATGTTRLMLGNSDLIVKKVFSLSPHKYTFVEIQDIVLYQRSANRKGELNNNRHYVLYFNDGNSMNLNFYFDSAEMSLPFVNHLSRKTNKEVVNVDVEPF